MGLEPKTEFVDGDLRDNRKAMLPVAAAFGGVIVPALTYVVVNPISNADPTTINNWGIPTVTDIAFLDPDDLSVLYLLLALLSLRLFTFLARKLRDLFMPYHWAAWVILLPIGILT